MTEADPYVDAWLRQEPEMALALTFAASADKRALASWGALLHQLYEAMFDIREPHVAQSKLAWWQQELVRGCSGDAAHPLVRELFALESARSVRTGRWQVLTGAALGLSSFDQVASGTDELLASRHAIASAIAAVEADLFQGDSEVTVIQRCLVMRQMRGNHSGACWPLQLRARLQLAGDGSDPTARAALGAALARELPDHPAAAPGTVLFRRLHGTIDQWQLRQLRSSGTFHTRPSPRLAWSLWRAARAGA